ncbi:MAG TPA: hypothetical protein VM282_23695 [Acidimicrobiales bacterium]|nr:hypothetical protein [Acidimicrobiales bacterium]
MKNSTLSGSPRRIRRIPLACLVTALALVVAACGGDDASSTVTLPPLGSSPITTRSTTGTTGGGGATTSPATTALDRACDSRPGVKCINIRSIAIAGQAITIEWDALNFTPSLQGFHAHFFWDTISPKQAGTNAAKFGATVGTWELTDKQPFRSENELRVANRPAAAKQVCVTVADNAHALVDPEVFDCIALPA